MLEGLFISVLANTHLTVGTCSLPIWTRIDRLARNRTQTDPGAAHKGAYTLPFDLYGCEIIHIMIIIETTQALSQ